MKKALRIFIFAITIISLFALCSCNAKDENMLGGEGYDGMLEGINGNSKPTNVYGEPSFTSSIPAGDSGLKEEIAPDEAPSEDGQTGQIVENPFIKTEVMDTSTFSADVDTASYTFRRKMINSGYSTPNCISKYPLQSPAVSP